MVVTVMTVCLRRLAHNRVELVLAFVVPIAFFSIFAVIFGSGVGTGLTPNIKVVGVDTVGDEQSRQILRVLRETPGLSFVDTAESDDQTEPEKGSTPRQKGSTPRPTPAPDETEKDLRAVEVQSASTSGNALTEQGDSRKADKQAGTSRRQAMELVRRGTATLAIVLRRQDDGMLMADLLSDSSDQVAPQVVSALVQQVLAGIPETSYRVPPRYAKTVSGPIGMPERGMSEPELPGTPSDAAGPPLPLKRVEIVDLLGKGKSNPVVTMYAAGIAVMFLLFGATSGGGTLLEERDNQMLDRLLTTGLSMDQLLIGKWAYLTILGICQTTLMFAWGQLVFGVDLLGHFDGFLIITVVTAGAAAAFGLLLATLCRTRGQLNGLSVVVVLSMSALGGSMVPRYLMSPGLREAGLWTFNAWALEGYDKVFWRELPVSELWPQMSVLMVCGAVFLVTARGLAIRWETD
ncbi:MAG: ABC transporter permease [Planctomycetaceae bacterium]|nr:MAG: ABC transporter permease [Planctomycetaceae bacterium]